MGYLSLILTTLHRPFGRIPNVAGLRRKKGVPPVTLLLMRVIVLRLLVGVGRTKIRFDRQRLKKIIIETPIKLITVPGAIIVDKTKTNHQLHRIPLGVRPQGITTHVIHLPITAMVFASLIATIAGKMAIT